MYNGIGLSTTRGSGTNGYVQQNKATLRQNFQRFDYKREDEKDTGLELQDELEEKGLSEQDVEKRVAALRSKLLQNLDSMARNVKDLKDHERHFLAEAKSAENDRFAQALGINSKSHVEGSAFDLELQEKKKQERILQQAKVEEDRRKEDEARSKAEEKKDRSEKVSRSDDHDLATIRSYWEFAAVSQFLHLFFEAFHLTEFSTEHAIQEKEKQRKLEEALANRKRSSRLQMREVQRLEEERISLMERDRLRKERRNEGGDISTEDDYDDFDDSRRLRRRKVNPEPPKVDPVKLREDRLRRRSGHTGVDQVMASEQSYVASERSSRKKKTPEPEYKSVKESSPHWYFSCTCGMKGQDLDDGNPMTACGRCSQWQHLRCAAISEGLSPDVSAEEWEDREFLCVQCRKEVSAATDVLGDGGEHKDIKYDQLVAEDEDVGHLMEDVEEQKPLLHGDAQLSAFPSDPFEPVNGISATPISQ
ncbi:hypothetical protein BC829DRAFT_439186 [Chytridium lagenaria]|nr:hypothetical protein BC829DRAFT_439186 [Chytridium lagenaria]